MFRKSWLPATILFLVWIAVMHTVTAATITVCVRKDAQTAEREAAKDLAHYIEVATSHGATVSSEAPTTAVPVIFVGAPSLSAEDVLPDPKLGPEAFATTRVGKSLTIAGRYPIATANGVYAFIEKYLGLRWFIPGPLGEYVPPKAQDDFMSRVRNEQVAPEYEPRTLSDNANYESWNMWSKRNRLSSPPQARWVNYKDYRLSMRIFPPEKYGQAHPEYYPLIKGKRYVPKIGDGSYLAWGMQPCYSNPDVKRLVVEDVRQFFAQNPDVPSYGLGLDDAEFFCECDGCRKMDDGVDAVKTRDFSNRYYRFLSEIAKEVKKTYPDKQIGALIYAATLNPPSNMNSLPPNTFAYVADTAFHASEWWKPKEKERNQSLVRRWRGRVSHLGRYEYLGFGWWVPRYYPHLLNAQFKFDRQMGVGSYYAEIYGFRPHYAPMLWATTKLLWNSGLSMDALLDEFVDKMFVEASAPMKRYWKIMEEAWIHRDPSVPGGGWRDLDAQMQVFSPPRLEAMENCLSQARNLARTDIVRERIAVFAKALEFSSYLIREHAMSQALGNAKVASNADAERLLKTAVRLDAIARRRAIRWEEIKGGNDFTGESVRGMMGAALGDFGALSRDESVVHDGVDRVVRFYEKTNVAAADSLLQSLKQRSPESLITRVLEAKLRFAKGELKNLLGNGDFDAEKDLPLPAQKGPVVWSTWQTEACPGKFSLQPGGAGKGKVLAQIEGALCAVLLYKVKVKPGEVYYVSARVRHRPASGKGKVALVGGLRDAQDKWLDGSSSQFRTELRSRSGNWETIQMVMEMPTRAADLTFMCAGEGMSPGEVAQFDDVVLLKVDGE